MSVVQIGASVGSRAGSNLPQVVVLQTLPQELGGDRLAVVHAALAWVFAQHSVDDYLLFPARPVSGGREARGVLMEVVRLAVQ